MARKPYTPQSYLLDQRYCKIIEDSRFPIRGYIPDSLIPQARRILSGRYQRLSEEANTDQIRRVVPAVYDAAKKRMALYEQQHHTGSDGPKEQSLEKRVEQTDLGGQKEILFGQDAEELGYCGCVPVSRQRQ